MGITLPSFIEKVPQPVIKQRLYNGRKLVVYECKVKINKITGWVDNPRLDLAKKSMMDKIGNRELTQDEVFDIMKNDKEIKLKGLRDDILKNGLREPLTLAHTGKLLDGNRRFFAIRYALDGMSVTDPNRQDLETIQAYVLSDDASLEDENNVLVEENFSASLKIEWPEYVKAQMVIKAYSEGLGVDEITKKFGWEKTKVRETIRINEIIEDFMVFATDPENPEDENGGGLGLSEIEAQNICAKYYQFFNEAQKSFHDALKTDVQFKMQFFRWIYEKKFMSFQEVRIAYKAWNSPEAMEVISQPGPASAKAAKAVLDYNERIIKTTNEALARISSVIDFLNSLNVTQLKAIPVETRDSLKMALEAVIKMSAAAE
jgi:hypothetical protein